MKKGKGEKQKGNGEQVSYVRVKRTGQGVETLK